jgi:hypothetical protein
LLGSTARVLVDALGIPDDRLSIGRRPRMPTVASSESMTANRTSGG